MDSSAEHMMRWQGGTHDTEKPPMNGMDAREFGVEKWFKKFDAMIGLC